MYWNKHRLIFFLKRNQLYVFFGFIFLFCSLQKSNFSLFSIYPFTNRATRLVSKTYFFKPQFIQTQRLWSVFDKQYPWRLNCWLRRKSVSRGEIRLRWRNWIFQLNHLPSTWNCLTGKYRRRWRRQYIPNFYSISSTKISFIFSVSVDTHISFASQIK